MVCPSPVPCAQGQPSPGQQPWHGDQPALLWLANLTGAHLGLAPIPQDPQDRCSIWENLVSLVDFQSPGFPLTSEELCPFMDIPRSSPAAVTPPGPPGALGDVDYGSEASAKPPYSYATLICMAMEASQQPKLTLAAICKWIRDNFCYFRRAHPSWQSSVRHNLCINKRFVKVPRAKGEPGRGAFWKLHPQYAQWLRSSTLRGHRALPEPAPAPGRSPGRVPSPAATSGGSGRGLQVGAELQRLLREFEEFESSHRRSPEQNQQSQQPWPEPSWPPGCVPPSPEGPRELAELRGSAEWDALLDAPAAPGPRSVPGHRSVPGPRSVPGHRSAPGHGSVPGPRSVSGHGSVPGPRSVPGQLPPPGAVPPHPAGPPLPPEPPAKPGLDESVVAAAFLEAAWGEERTGSGPAGPGAAGAPSGAGGAESGGAGRSGLG